ncbi:MAG: hypothetical protein ACKO3N_06765, partial [Verrucomicrobiota bacterium]
LFSAALASLYDEHHFDLCWGAAGTGLVLRHEPGQPDHRHCPVALLLVSLAQPGGSAHADHVLRFGSVPEELAPGRGRPGQTAGAPPAGPAPAFPGLTLPPSRILRLPRARATAGLELPPAIGRSVELRI